MNTEPSLRKAAVLIASLDVDSADLLLSQMPQEQANMVRQQMVDLGEVDLGEQQAVLDEFFRIGKSPDDNFSETDEPRSNECAFCGPHVQRSDHHAANQNLFGSYSGQPSPSIPPFSSLAKAPLEAVVAILEREHPQTVALVLAHVPPERAGHVLARLPAGVQTEVIRRLVDQHETDPHVVLEIERAISSRLDDRNSPSTSKSGMAALAAILHASGPAARRQIVGNLAAHDHRLARQIAPPVQTKRFTYSEVCGLPLESLRCLIQTADRRTAVLSLAGTSAELVDELLEFLDPQQADWFARRLTNLGPLRLADIDRAQEDIAALAGQLLAEGRLEGYSNAHLTAVV